MTSSVAYLVPGTHGIVRGTTVANHSHSRTLGIAGALSFTTYTESLTREAFVAGASRVYFLVNTKYIYMVVQKHRAVIFRGRASYDFHFAWRK